MVGKGDTRLKEALTYWKLRHLKKGLCPPSAAPFSGPSSTIHDALRNSHRKGLNLITYNILSRRKKVLTLAALRARAHPQEVGDDS